MQDNKNNIILIQGMVDESLFDLLKERGEINVFILEGRPRLKAANILSKELNKRQITPTLIADNMAGFLFKRNLVKEVWVSYQKVDKKGARCDTGALVLGVLGKRHQVPVNLYPAAAQKGAQGKQSDILSFNGVRVAPKGVKGYVPLTDWVPAKYISKVHSCGCCC
ncbi:MAG: hypothetical protein A2787_07355 [Omnitrophica WOR_2 bacterium RIFCSPHIGHO2_01_FULL_48_9]|nr:MAG: hypothetical protein A3D10_06390 [Omnitrophica WOR_2 bacterium RIFCSPHIGHO2_02_FULL_48_11]OGX33566.1 MAG: hypothetical protein A2787_07355 [Omnitrophica WOR_2 bacterium RIFCSPHIGHO2_01_FULL_48_9]